ncbi:MAG: 4'-phosphopantetheinyl transferase family protein [Planctomycetota bacterium]
MNKPSITVYQIDLSAAARHAAAADALLSTGERNRADRFKVPGKREQFSVSRACLRLLLGQLCGCAPQELVFHSNGRGKPHLADSHWHFNLSHSGDCLLLACSPHMPIGVDVEHLDVRVDIQGLSRRFFASDEYQAIMLHQPRERIRAFFTCWTGKEAFLKCLGTGIDRALDTIVIGQLEDLNVPVRKVHGFGTVHDERIHSLNAPAHHLASLAVASTTPVITCQRPELADLL